MFLQLLSALPEPSLSSTPLTGHLDPPPVYTAQLCNALLFSIHMLQHIIAASGFLSKTVAGNEQLFPLVSVQLRNFGACPLEQRARVCSGILHLRSSAGMQLGDQKTPTGQWKHGGQGCVFNPTYFHLPRLGMDTIAPFFMIHKPKYSMERQGNSVTSTPYLKFILNTEIAVSPKKKACYLSPYSFKRH